MKIEVASNPKKWWEELARIRFIWYMLIVLVLLVMVSLVSMFYGMKIYQSGAAGSINYKLHDFYTTRFGFVGNWLEGLMASTDEFVLDIKFEDLQKIRHHRSKSIELGVVTSTTDEDEVSATLTHEGRQYPVKVSLTGFTLRHVADAKKWSFRIKVKGDRALLGMQEFSLMYPAARGYVSDWIGHKIQEREGLIAMRLKYVNVTVNGDDLGLYCLEEGYDKLLVENNQLKEGILFKWGDLPDMYNTKDILKNPSLKESAVVLRRLVKSFNIGDVGIEEVFDLPKMAKFFAMNDILNGYHHGISLSNTRYYFNPSTNLVEPIAREWLINANKYPGGQEEMALAIEYLKDAPFFNRFFYNTAFMALYIQELKRFSNPEYLDAFFTDVQPELDELLQAVYKDNPFYSYPKSFLYGYQEYIRNKIYPSQAIAAYYNGIEEGKLNIFLRNLGCLPLQIEEVIYNNEVKLPASKKVVVQGSNASLSEYEIERASRSSIHENLEVTIPQDLRKEDISRKLSIKYAIVGIDSSYIEDIFPWPFDQRNEMVNSIRTYSDLDQFDFIQVDTVFRNILFKQGAITLDQNLVIPAGYTVNVHENTHIDLQRGASILSYSPLKLLGSVENPIIVTSTDSTGQGIYVVNAGSKSYLENIRFSYLSNPVKVDWSLSGAITFYKSDVSIVNCEFVENKRGDDYLNIVDSRFSITNTLFKDVLADAFDCDFCEGTLNETSFLHTGNDAIDVSDSKIDLSKVQIDGAGDKALSAGERSELTASDIKILNSEIAISSKDLSLITINRAFLDQNRIGLNAFQKKPEFGPGSIVGSFITQQQTELPYLIEINSYCRIDGQQIESTIEDVESILYGVEYGKSSN